MSVKISIRRRTRLGRVPLLLATSLIISCGAPSPPATQPTPPPPAPQAAPAAYRIVILGDSIAAGLGLAQSEAFPAVTEELLRAAGHDAQVVNAGVSGDTSAGGLARLDWLLRQQPDVLVVELGGNDALRGQPVEHTEETLIEIVRRAAAAGARVVLLGMDIPTNYGPDYTAAFAAMYERIARSERVPLVPGFVREVGMNPSLMQGDGLHPNAAGHRRLAMLLLPHLEDVLRSDSDTDSVTDKGS